MELDEPKRDLKLAKANVNEEKLIRPTIKRYIILFLFCVNSGNKAFQWIHIPASTKKVTFYYDVNNYVINTMSVIFLLAFVVLCLPSCCIIEVIGLRKAILIGSFGTALGSVVKCFCCNIDYGIYLLTIGQILVSMSEQFIFAVPSRLASVWFPDHQVSSAVAMTVLGSSLGVALGFMVPQLILNEAETREEIGHELYVMFLGTAILSVAAFVADWALFDEAPKYPPGAARLRQIQDEEASKANRQVNIRNQVRILSSQVRQLLCNRDYVLLVLSYGISVGLGYTINTILNQMLEPLWPGDDILVGNSGFVIIIVGAFGSAIFGHLLDKTRRYRLANILLTIGGILSIVIFGYTVSGMHSRWAIYFGSAMIGLFQTGTVVAGLELAVELTYPLPELATSSLINISPQVFGTFFVYISSYIIDNHGAIATNVFYICCFLISLLFLLNLKETLNRQIAVTAQQSMEKQTGKQVNVSISTLSDQFDRYNLNFRNEN